MTSYCPSRRFLAGAILFALAWFGIAACADAAPAAPVCGLYVDGAQNALYLESADSARLEPEQDTPRRFHLLRDGNRLQLFDLDNGRGARYVLSADAAQIRAADGTVYRRGSSAACAAPAPAATAAIAQCRADLPACAQRLAQADRAQAAALCGPQLPFACRALLDPAPAAATAPAQAGAAVQPEAVCRRSASAQICTAAAERQWDAGKFLRAKALLEQACALSDPVACGRTTALEEVDATLLQSPPATRLPCGRFIAPLGTSLSLQFRDDGSVRDGNGDVMQAHLEHGQIALRQRDGQQWQLRPLGAKRLIGLDRAHRFVVLFGDETGHCGAAQQ
ncbi:hypothetical protein [Xanthomonas translucens]|uniref:Lipoprotein n=6 Tax=Xanthomonas campestris pv. translucens TaxID=343 RepID=A0ABW9KVR8_XANCT|nr:hypothetical protein [Xanthomonas translucens]KTF41523.1 hypothetical protein OZ12_01250 [Xanthomonas translucens pv. translucens]MCS3358441.1 hypothetical protein [Xanthomonas translucens pv. translucens]MCS3371974.1 hypothetical protein [Xanthomonas translucens pv. translucens]MCT8273747.1 hypothetical protein [Xanthomonas translucens pv. translucens]MCT8277067.1 hypothetical protein [Xanthomonas translucens pv. translucens]